MEYLGEKDPRLLSRYLLLTDVLLLVDVFEVFRDTCLKNYGLDPVHFYTTPGLAWQALLKTATMYCEHEERRKECELCPDEFRLELLTNLDMMLMVAKAFGVGLPRQLKVMPGLIISK